MQVFLRNFRLSLDYKWKNLFYVWELEKYSVEHKEFLSNCAEIYRENKISAGANTLRTLRYLFPIGFFDKSVTVLPREVQKSI